MYPYQPATGKTDTSAEAAEAIRPSVTQIKAMILDRLREAGPQTSVELAKAIGEEYETTQPRTSEMRALGWIRDSGLRGPSRNPKRNAIKWEVVDD